MFGLMFSEAIFYFYFFNIFYIYNTSIFNYLIQDIVTLSSVDLHRVLVVKYFSPYCNF